MVGGLASIVHSILGVDNPNTGVLDATAEQARQRQAQYGSREAQNYGQEQQLAGSLNGTIAGTAPSVARNQLQQGLDQNNADSMAAGAGASGVNAVLAHYQARQAAGEQAARMNAAAAELRAREVAMAQAQLGQLHQNMAGQSIGLYGSNLDDATNFLKLKAQMDQQNAQRDTVLGAAGLQGASQIGAGLSSAGADYFRGGGGGGGTGGGYGAGFTGQGDSLMQPSF